MEVEMKKRKLFCLIAISHTILLSATEIKRLTINSMQDIKNLITSQTLFVLDIDDTILYDSEHSATGLIEPSIFPQFLNMIKKKSWGTVAITARNTTTDYQLFTLEQLRHFNVNFTPFFHDDKKHMINCILLNDGNKAYYLNGVVFVQGTNKGNALHAFLSHLPELPEHIIFVDDRPYNLDNVNTVFKNNRDFPQLKKIILCDYPYVKNHL